MGKIQRFERVQMISAEIEKIWDFFSDHKNLQAITAPDPGFKILSKAYTGKIYPGQVIDYKVSPVLGIPLYWMTEITHVTDTTYFVDEKRFGTYDVWHHLHHSK